MKPSHCPNPHTKVKIHTSIHKLSWNTIGLNRQLIHLTFSLQTRPIHLKSSKRIYIINLTTDLHSNRSFVLVLPFFSRFLSEDLLPSNNRDSDLSPPPRTFPLSLRHRSLHPPFGLRILHHLWFLSSVGPPMSIGTNYGTSVHLLHVFLQVTVITEVSWSLVTTESFSTDLPNKPRLQSNHISLFNHPRPHSTPI